MDIRTPKYDLYDRSDSIYRIVIKSNLRLAWKLNRELGTYEPNCFLPDDEPIFDFPKNRLKEILLMVGASQVWVDELAVKKVL